MRVLEYIRKLNFEGWTIRVWIDAKEATRTGQTTELIVGHIKRLPPETNISDFSIATSILNQLSSISAVEVVDRNGWGVVFYKTGRRKIL